MSAARPGSRGTRRCAARDAVRRHHRQRPHRRRHRRAVVPGRYRHHRRPDRRHRRARRRDGRRRRVDATNLVVAPGFIDLLGQSEFNVLVDGRAASKMMQGVTTEVTGEGSSIAPVNDRLIAGGGGQRDTLRRRSGLAHARRLFPAARAAVPHRRSTSATFVGAGGIRNYVIGKDDRPATPAELDRMRAAGRQAMEQGALGLSTSLQYVPDRFASTDEIVELAKVAAQLRRRVLHAPAIGERADLRVARRGVRDRRAREDPRGDLAPEDGIQSEFRQDA